MALSKVMSLASPTNELSIKLKNEEATYVGALKCVVRFVNLPYYVQLENGVYNYNGEVTGKQVRGACPSVVLGKVVGVLLHTLINS